MKIIAILAIIGLACFIALAAPAEAPEEINIGLSPLQPAAERTKQQCLLQRFLLSQCPTSTRVVIWDAWQLQVLCDIPPFQLAYDSPAARAPRLAPALAAIVRWSVALPASQTPANLKDSAAVKLPEWLEAVAATPTAVRRTIVILASPFCIVPDEPSFSMLQARFPSDAHLGQTTATSIYGVADKHRRLANTSVLWAFSSEDLFASQYHRRCVLRWWCLYIASQGPNAVLAGFSSDTATILLQSLLTAHQPIGEFAVDASDTAMVMHVATERRIPVQVPQAKFTPPPELPERATVIPPPQPATKASEPQQPSAPPEAQPTQELPEPKPAAVPPRVQIKVEVGVTDSAGIPVTGLSKADFTVAEDGVEQGIGSFSIQRAPTSVVLLIDTSGSIIQKLDKIRAAASRIIHQVGDQDEFCVMEFKASTTVVQDFTSNAASADRALATLKAGGQTALLDALKFALDYATQKGKQQRKGIVLITDGGEADSHSSRADVIPLLQRSDVQFYAVGFPEGLDINQSPDPHGHGPVRAQPTEALARDLLATLAKASSGGLVFYPRQGDEMGRIADSIISDLRAPRYTLGYYSVRPQTDPGWRSLRILIRRFPQRGPLTVRTRAGYFPGQAVRETGSGTTAVTINQLIP